MFLFLCALLPMTVMAQYEKYIDAAKQGDVDAQYNVGLYYYRGQGVEKNFTQALYWFTKAAEQGHEGAKETLQELGL